MRPSKRPETRTSEGEHVGNVGRTGARDADKIEQKNKLQLTRPVLAAGMAGVGAGNKLRGEVLALYREILRTSRVFRGQKNKHGDDWGKLIVRSARSEIEEARSMSDSEEVTRRIVVGRDALYKIHEKIMGQLKSGN